MRHNLSYPRRRRKTGKLFLWIAISLVCLVGSLAGLAVISPVFLVFHHVTTLPGLSANMREDFDLLADLIVVEPSGSQDQSANIIHALTITLSEEALEQMLSEALTQKPHRLLSLTNLHVSIAPNRLLVECDAEYEFLGRPVFSTSFTSEWILRASPSLLASPVPNVVELTPLTIQADYWPSQEWLPLWKLMTRPHSEDSWLALEFTSSFRLEDLTLEEGELFLSIAPAL